MMELGIARAAKTMKYTFGQFCQITIYPQQKWQYCIDDNWVTLTNRRTKIIISKQDFAEEWKKIKFEEIE